MSVTTAMQFSDPTKIAAQTYVYQPSFAIESVQEFQSLSQNLQLEIELNEAIVRARVFNSPNVNTPEERSRFVAEIRSHDDANIFVMAGQHKIDISKPNDGRTWVYKVIKELAEAGFMLSDALVDSKGLTFLMYFVKESPQLMNQSRFLLGSKFVTLDFFMANDVMRLKSVLANSFYEKNMLFHIGAQYRGGDIIDVGANVGNHTIYFSELCANESIVFSIEPGETALNLLRKNVIQNHAQNRVQIFECAVGQEEGSVQMKYGSSTNLGAMKVSSITGPGDSGIPMKMLDSLIPDERHVSVIKIDVEGFEMNALKGAHRILSKQRPDIYIEAAKAEYLEPIREHLSLYNYVHQSVFNDTPTHWFKVV